MAMPGTVCARLLKSVNPLLAISAAEIAVTLIGVFLHGRLALGGGDHNFLEYRAALVGTRDRAASERREHRKVNVNRGYFFMRLSPSPTIIGADRIGPAPLILASHTNNKIQDFNQ